MAGGTQLKRVHALSLALPATTLFGLSAKIGRNSSQFANFQQAKKKR
jgi:hypothetical protein